MLMLLNVVHYIGSRVPFRCAHGVLLILTGSLCYSQQLRSCRMQLSNPGKHQRPKRHQNRSLTRLSGTLTPIPAPRSLHQHSKVQADLPMTSGESVTIQFSMVIKDWQCITGVSNSDPGELLAVQGYNPALSTSVLKYSPLQSESGVLLQGLNESLHTQ